MNNEFNNENLNDNSRADEVNNDSSFIDRIGHYINTLSDKKENPNNKYRFLKQGDQEKLEKLIDKLYNDAPSCKNMIRQKLNLQSPKNLNESSFMEKSFSLVEENSKEPEKETQNVNQMNFIGVDNSFNEVSIDNDSENEKQMKTEYLKNGKSINKKKEEEEEKINHNGYSLRSRDKVGDFKSPIKLNNKKNGNFNKANLNNNNKKNTTEIKAYNKKLRKKSKSKSPVIKIEDTYGKSASSEAEEEEEEPEIIDDNYQNMNEDNNEEGKKNSIKIPNFKIDRVINSSKNDEIKSNQNSNLIINQNENIINAQNNNLNNNRIIQKENNNNINNYERQNINQNINNYSNQVDNNQMPSQVTNQYSNQQNNHYLDDQYVNNQDINRQISYFQNQNHYLNMSSINNNQYYNQNIYNNQYESEYKPNIIYDELVNLVDKFGVNNIVDYLLMYNFNDYNNQIQNELYQKLKNILLIEKLDNVIISLIKIMSNNYYNCQQKIIFLLQNTRKANNEVHNYNNNLYYQQQVSPQNVINSPEKNDLLHKKRAMCHSPPAQHNQIKNGTSERKKFFFNVEKY